MEENFFCALILAAGKGTRMKSDLAKVLHVLEGKPLEAKMNSEKQFNRKVDFNAQVREIQERLRLLTVSC